MPFLAAVLLILSSAPARSSATPQPSTLRFEHSLYSVTFPAGWFPAEHLPASFRRLPNAALANLRDVHVVAFADRTGSFFIIFADEGTELQVDAFWTLRADEGGRIAITGEGETCTRPGSTDPDSDDACAAGDGRLEIGCAAVEIGGHYFAFLFGNARKETGVPLQPFRNIIATFRAR